MNFPMAVDISSPLRAVPWLFVMHFAVSDFAFKISKRNPKEHEKQRETAKRSGREQRRNLGYQFLQTRFAE